jgi:hypothetical protein
LQQLSLDLATKVIIGVATALEQLLLAPQPYSVAADLLLIDRGEKR